jgi:hypothetical protein
MSMAIIVSNKDTATRNPVSEGVHIATCIRVIDLGTQFSKLFGNNVHKVMITWEVSDDMIMHDGEEKPKLISKEYTMSLNEKATLRKHLEAWRNKKFTEEELKGFDLANVLNVPCQLQVLHNDNGYANIAAVMAVPKGMARPPVIHDTMYFDLTDAGCLTEFEKLPDWIKDKIKQSPEYLNLTEAQADCSEDMRELGEEETDDLPF